MPRISLARSGIAGESNAGVAREAAHLGFALDVNAVARDLTFLRPTLILGSLYDGQHDYELRTRLTFVWLTLASHHEQGNGIVDVKGQGVPFGQSRSFRAFARLRRVVRLIAA